MSALEFVKEVGAFALDVITVAAEALKEEKKEAIYVAQTFTIPQALVTTEAQTIAKATPSKPPETQKQAPKADAVGDTKKVDVKSTSGGISLSQYADLVDIYEGKIGDQEKKCLREARMFMQEIARQGHIDLPGDKKNGGWGNRAQDFGTEIKGHVKNGLPGSWKDKHIGVADLSRSNDSVEDITTQVQTLQGDIFALAMRKGDDAGHAVTGYRIDGKIYIYDNTFINREKAGLSGSSDVAAHTFTLAQYIDRMKGKYDFDAVMSIPYIGNDRQLA